ncbi:MAG: hypothetical protein KJN98_06435 [Pontiella sp.]|nr:hypothetical protein [Pontiella sp.]
MKRKASIILSMALAASAIAENTNIESERNLKTETEVELKEVSEITNRNNPVDIFKLVRLKIEQEKYDDAVLAFGVGTGYGMYDMLRVADNTAHQALRVMQRNAGTGLSQDKQDKFQTTLKAFFENPDRLSTLLKKVGKPAYHPTYMIQHGTGTFTGNKTKDDLVLNFDPEKVWKEILDGLQ